MDVDRVGNAPVVSVACTGQVTAGNPGSSGTQLPSAASDSLAGIRDRSSCRRPGIESIGTWTGGDAELIGTTPGEEASEEAAA